MTLSSIGFDSRRNPGTKKSRPTAPLIGQLHVQWQHMINTLLTALKELQYRVNNIKNLVIFYETKYRRDMAVKIVKICACGLWSARQVL
jgi:hypothetical protein